MNRCLLFLAILAVVPWGGQAQAIRKRVPASSFETVTLVYTANTRGRHADDGAVAPASALQTLIQGLRREYGNLLLIDLGNFMGPTPPSILTEGKLDFDVIQRLGYDVVHPSSDEFVAGAPNLRKQVLLSPIPVVTGNLDLGGAKSLSWTVLTCGNRKVGFIGLTSADFPNLVMANTRQGVDVLPAVPYITGAIQEMEGKADIIVALTDLGEAELTDIRTIPGLDLILTTGGLAVKPGADWISVGFPGTKRAAIARVLSPGPAVQVLEVHGYPQGNKWTVDEVVGAVYEVSPETPRDPGVEAWLQGRLDEARRSHGAVLGTLARPLDNVDGRSRQTDLGHAMGDLMRSQTGAHLAWVDSGALKIGLPSGPISEWNLIEAVPYPDQVVVLRLTGEQITAVLARSKKKVGEEGYLQLSNLATEPKAPGNRIGSLKIDAGRSYLVAMPEFLAQGGDGYEELKDAPVVDRESLSLLDLCRQAFRTYGTLVPPQLPMETEDRFWFSKLSFSAAVNGFAADPKTAELYPDQTELVGEQLVASTVETRLDVNRMDAASGLENYVALAYGLSWGEDWVPSQTQDTLKVGSQLTVYLSNLWFNGDRIVDPYVSGLLETALVYPDPTHAMFETTTTRPGTLKLAGGVSATTLLRPLSLKLGYRWENQPFNPQGPVSKGIEGIVSCQADVVEDVLSFNTATEVFSSLDSPTQGVTVSSLNEVFLSIKDNVKVGPRLQLYYNSLVGHWAYLVDVAVVVDFVLR